MSGHKPRILYVITLAEVGGAQTYVRNLLALSRSSYDIAVAAHGTGPLRDAARELGVPFIPLHHVRREISPLRDFRGLVELVRLFRSFKPDIVHLNSSKVGILGSLAARISSVPTCVFTVHGWAFSAAENTAMSAAYRVAHRLTRPFNDRIVCVSKIESRIGLHARACTASQVVVIANAVESSGVACRPSIPARDPLCLISVGRLADPKDFETLLQALALIPRGAVSLEIVGDGPQMARLVERAKQLGLNGTVTFVGEAHDVTQRLAKADVFVLSSRSEGMPLSVLEAMSAALPVVATEVGGLPEIVLDGQTGFLVPPEDPPALAAAMQAFVIDPNLALRLGTYGRERVETTYSLPRWEAAHMSLYTSLVERFPGKKPAE